MMIHEDATRQEATASPVRTVYTRMGELLGLPIQSEADVWRLLKTGVPARRYKHLMKRLHLTLDSVGSETTMRRRLQELERLHRGSVDPRSRRGKLSGKHVHLYAQPPVKTAEPRLSQAESERLVRLTRVVSEATELFGDENAALEWLNKPADFLRDDKPVSPMKLAETDSGARMVESMIRRTAHGFF